MEILKQVRDKVTQILNDKILKILDQIIKDDIHTFSLEEIESKFEACKKKIQSINIEQNEKIIDK